MRARDNAGNESEVTHSVTVGLGMLTISLRSPLDGAVYLLGAEVLADYACADEPGGSPFPVPVMDGGWWIDTTAVGEQSFTVEAVDLAGNSAAPRAGWSSTSASGGDPRAAGRQRAARAGLDAAGEVLARRLSAFP